MSSMNHYIRTLYLQAIKKAEYYRWAAQKGFSIAGNDPLTGKKRSDTSPMDAAEGREAYKAMPKFWFIRAAAIRTAQYSNRITVI